MADARITKAMDGLKCVCGAPIKAARVSMTAHPHGYDYEIVCNGCHKLLIEMRDDDPPDLSAGMMTGDE